MKTTCPCFSSDDCAPTFVCHAEDTSGLNVWCIPGARGTGVAGVLCTGQDDCASALCFEPSAGPKRCTQLCDQPSQCPPELPRCLVLGFGVDRAICVP